MNSATSMTLRHLVTVAVVGLFPAVAFAQIAAVRVPDSRAHGVLVTSVTPNSTAAQAGLHAGDIILRVNDRRVTELWEFVERLSQANGAARLSVYDRNTGKFRLADVRPDNRGLIGVYGIPTNTLANYQNSVLFVNGVNPGSPADFAGLQPGDVILQVNGWRVPTTWDFVQQFRFSGRVATVTYLSGFDGSLRVAAVPADPRGQIGAFIVPVPWR